MKSHPRGEASEVAELSRKIRMNSRKEPELLCKGKSFHRKIQAAWLATADGVVESEKSVIKVSGRKGRIDVFADGGNTKALVEIKATNWDSMTNTAIKRNVCRHARQIWNYVEVQPNNSSGVCPGIVFPKRPAAPCRMRLIEKMFAAEGIAVAWEDETVKERQKRTYSGRRSSSALQS